MQRPRLLLVGIVLAASLVAAGIALAQDDARVPEISSTYTIDRENGHTDFCIEINAERLEGQIFDVEFTGSWPPPITTPRERFGPPGEWEWEPFPGGGWQAKTSVPMERGRRYCFRLPVTSVPDPVTLTASTKTPSGQHQPYLTFMSRPPDQRSALGDVPRRFTFGGAEATGIGVLQPADVFCRPDTVEDRFVLASPSPGRITILRAGTDESATGRIDALGHFTAAGETASYVGRVRGRSAVVGYRDGRRPPCEQSFVGTIELDRAGRSAPACARPTIVAPRRARVVRASRVSLRIAATCAGARLARWPVEITVPWRGRSFRAGAFRTAIAPRAVTVRLGDTRPRTLVIRAAGGKGLAPAVARVRLVYP